MGKIIAELKKKNESLTKALNVFVFEESRTPKKNNIKHKWTFIIVIILVIL